MNLTSEKEKVMQRLGLRFIHTNEYEIAIAGINALAKEFRIPADQISGDDVLFATIKPPFLRDVDAMNIVLSVEAVIGRFVDAKYNSLLYDIYLVKVDHWLARLVEAFQE